MPEFGTVTDNERNPVAQPSPAESANTIARGDRSVAAGGDMLDNVVITGDGNTVTVNVYDELKRGRAISPKFSSSDNILTALINRTEQMRRVRTAIALRESNKLHRPIVCVISGDEDEMRELFVQRLEEYELRNLLPQGSSAAPQRFSLPVPAEELGESDMHRRLREELADSVNRFFATSNQPAGANWTELAGSPAQLNASLRRMNRPVIVEGYLHADDWGRQGLPYFHKCLSFWESWPELGTNQWLFVVLHVQVAPQRQVRRRWAFWDRNKEQVSGGSVATDLASFSTADPPADRCDAICVVLPPFESIREQDVLTWARRPDVSQFMGGVDLVNQVTDLYDRWTKQHGSDAIPMRYLREQLNGLLQQA